MASGPEVPPTASAPDIDMMNDPAYATNSSGGDTGVGISEPDHCRICRSEGTPEEPLYHPCKCSGSIKFVHQNCLMEWLQHSQKKYCELCKTPFTFTKVYDKNMPSSLPTPLFVQQLTRRLFRGLLFWARASLATFVWAGCLPWIVRWMWRMWFWVGDGGWWQLPVGGRGTVSSFTIHIPANGTSAANWTGVATYLASGRSLSGAMSPVNGGSNVTLSSTIPTANLTLLDGYTDGIFFDQNPFAQLTKFQFINRMIIDVLEGQLLTSLIVVCFIIIFLVREWVVQQQPALMAEGADIPLLDEQAAPFPVPPPRAPDVDVRPAAEEEEELHPPAGEANYPEPPGFGNPAGGVQNPALVPPLDDDSDDGLFRPAFDSGDREPADRIGAHVERAHNENWRQRVILQPRRRRRVAPEHVDDSTPGGSDEGENSDRGASSSFTFVGPPRRPTPTRENTAQATELKRDLEETDRSTSAGSSYDFGGMRRSTDDLYHFGGGNPAPSRPSEAWTPRLPRETDDRDTLEIAGTGRPMGWRGERTYSGPASPSTVSRAPENERRRWSFEAPDEVGADRSGSTSWGSASSFEIIGNPPNKGKGKAEQGSAPDQGDSERPGWKGKEVSVPSQESKGEPSEEFADEDGFRTGGIESSEWSTTAQAGDTPIPWDSSPSTPPATVELEHPDGQTLEDTPLTEPLRNLPRQPPQTEREGTNLPDDQFAGTGAQVAAPQPAPVQAQVELVRPADQARNNDAPDGRRGGILDWILGDVPERMDDERGDEAENGANDNGPQGAVAAGVPQALVEDDAADDLEGIMELVGMRGPVIGLIQNAAISSVLITVAVALGVAFPYVAGKTVMMVLAHPFIFFIRLPAQLISWCAEVVVDTATMFGFSLLLIGEQIVKFFFQPVSHIVPSLSWFASNDSVAKFLRDWAMDGQRRVFGKFYAIETNYVAMRRYPPSAIPPLSFVVKDGLDRFHANFVWALGKVGLARLASAAFWTVPQFELPGFSITNPVSWAVNVWHDAFPLDNLTQATNTTGIPEEIILDAQPLETISWSTMDRIGVVLLGYAFFTTAGFIYIRRRREEQSNTGRLVVQFLQQCGGVMKVVLIIGIEMIVFPLYCGILLDVAMLPLFEHATIASRLRFAVNFPLTNAFVHWFVGTCYMFHFALFVSMCRKIMRAGVLYFIRDPDDPTFHPVRDVLNRPIVTQLRKIGFSAFIYGVLVLVCLGGVVWGLAGVTDSVLPVHWSSNEPVLEFPVDLLFYNFLMPFAVKFFKPSEGLQKIYAWWFQVSARALRLSSFMFGERKNDEEGYTYHPSWTSICMLQKADTENPVLPGEFGPLDQVHFRRTGRFVRAPASDSVRRLKGTAVFLPVDESNRRLDIDPSLDPPNGPTGANNPEWRLVYLPPMFKLRLTLVVVGIWGFTAATGIGITIGPLLLGRYILGQLVPPNVRLNDIYAFSVGLYITAGAVFCLSKLPTLYQKAISTFGPITAVPATSPSVLQKLQQFLLRTAKVSYVLTAFAIVIPTLVAMIIEFYVIIPLHTAFGEAATPSTSAAVPVPPPQPSGEQQLGNRVHTLHFVQDWTLGVLYVKMMGRMMLLDDTSPWARSLRGIIQQGWLNPDVRLATKVFILPGVAGMLSALLLPLILARGAIALGVGEEVVVYRYAFPAVLLAAGIVGVAYAAWRVLEGWKVKVRDEVYLRGVRVHNLGEDAPAVVGGVLAGRRGVGEMVF